MTCLICKHGETEPGITTVTLQRGETSVIVKGVPAEVCDNCSEYYLSEEVTSKVLSLAEDAARNRVEVEILRFAA
ncbi:MAG: type II toxin-antitoxin system MqsA family antitoxin [Deltaproteobacteria bacterium]|nr:type II toxin-antitoxin system MqsA family antitoxin [Deltaproteobacteria bacterium]